VTGRPRRADGAKIGRFDPVLAGIIRSAAVRPASTTDPRVAAARLAADGVAVLRGVTGTEAALDAAMENLLGPALVGREQPRDQRATDEPALELHTDGGGGWPVPDRLFLLCVERAAGAGGASLVADGWALCDLLAADPRSAPIAGTLRGVPVDHNGTWHRSAGGGGRDDTPAFGFVDGVRPNGRRQINRTPYARPRPEDPAFAVHDAWLDRFDDAVATLTELAPRFTLGPGDLLCLDNDRVLHGRDAITAPRRLLVQAVYTRTGDPPPGARGDHR
jgi:hypothetical protein